jgi:hypothetical protein
MMWPRASRIIATPSSVVHVMPIFSPNAELSFLMKRFGSGEIDEMERSGGAKPDDLR